MTGRPSRVAPVPGGVTGRQGVSRELADRLAAAKLWLISAPVPGGAPTGQMPYLAVALYALVPVATDRVARMATDTAWRLYVNPGWAVDPDVDVPALGRELAHHTWHLLADHGARAGDVGVRPSTSRAWRVAADVTVHEVLADLPGLPPPPGPPARGPRQAPASSSGAGSAAGSRRPIARTPAARVTAPGSGRTPAHVVAARAAALGDRHELLPPRALGLAPGRAAEEHFAVLSGLPADLGADTAGATDPDPTAADGRDPGERGLDGDPSWQPRSAAPDGQGDTDGPSAAAPGMAAAPARPAVGPDPSCGAGCDGMPRGYELPSDDAAGGLDGTTAEAVRRTVAIAFREQRGRGSVPGEWGRWVEQLLDPIVDWRSVLHAAVRRGVGWAHGHTDYTYTRIARRQAAAGPVILPALRRPVPRVAVVVDTSGSVDDGLLAQALGEVDGVLATLGVADPQVTVLAVDAAVHTVATVRRADAIRLGGGGGTDMAVGITAAQELRPRVDVIIVCTDGETDWPAHPAPVPVVAVLLGRTRAALPDTPDWIHRVECVLD